MKKFSQKSLLLFGVMLAVSAFVVPSMASAASWFQVGTTHQLFSSNLSFTAHTSPLGGEAGSSCAASEFDADVRSAQVLTITSGRFNNCTGTFAAANCVATPRFTGHWSATAISTTNIQIHDVIVDVLFEGGANCVANGATAVLTGTISGGAVWQPAANDALFSNATGLTAHFPGLSSSTTVNGTLRDTSNTLRVFD
jgi:hypothetical protein